MLTSPPAHGFGVAQIQPGAWLTIVTFWTTALAPRGIPPTSRTTLARGVSVGTPNPLRLSATRVGVVSRSRPTVLGGSAADVIHPPTSTTTSLTSYRNSSTVPSAPTGT